jgi:hypothetical protein
MIMASTTRVPFFGSFEVKLILRTRRPIKGLYQSLGTVAQLANSVLDPLVHAARERVTSAGGSVFAAERRRSFILSICQRACS